MDISYLIEDLNEQQRDAVCADESNALVLAGAGSGKTRVLVHRLAWLIEVLKVSPNSILAISFTNKAAKEMRSRMERLMGHSASGIWCGTFHGIANRILRQHYEAAGLSQNFQIIDSTDQQRLIKRVLEEINLDAKKFTPKQAQYFINNHKEEGRRCADVERSSDYMHNNLLHIYTVYEKIAAAENLVDFAELLLRTYELLKGNKDVGNYYAKKFRHILVDEFQDTNEMQCALIKLLQGEEKENYVTAVGDEDQSIYGWRGADIGNILNFDKLFSDVKVFCLEQNYRSTINILQAANAVIENNKGRLGKTLWSDIKNENLIEIYRAADDRQEADFIAEMIIDYQRKGVALKDCAVFYRANAQSRIIEETLVKRSVPYRIYGGLRFYDRAEIKNALAYMRLIISRDDNESFRRIVNIPTRGMGASSLRKIMDAAEERNVSFWTAAEMMIESSGLPKRSANSMKLFMQLIDKISADIAGLGLKEQTALIIKQSGLENMYETSKDEGAKSAVENLRELINAADVSFGDGDYINDMTVFLNNIALESGGAQAKEHQDAAQLMTMHSAKGLEFPVVFISGMEEGVFPLESAKTNDEDVEEERRLCYVGMTRARQQLYLTCSETRRLYGREAYNPISRFVEEIPVELTHTMGGKYFRFQKQTFESPLAKKGQRVMHPSFGYGVVVGSEGTGENARVEVDFESEGNKWLVLQYAQLEML